MDFCLASHRNIVPQQQREKLGWNGANCISVQVSEKKRVSKEFQNIKNARHDSILAVLYNVHVGVGGEQKLKRMEMDNMATFI